MEDERESERESEKESERESERESEKGDERECESESDRVMSIDNELRDMLKRGLGQSGLSPHIISYHNIS